MPFDLLLPPICAIIPIVISMNILVLGDIFGQPGRKAVKELLPKLKTDYKPDLIVANAENLSHGKGFTDDHIQEMLKAGINLFTSGNHIWKQKSSLPKIDDKSYPLLRPANYPPGVIGRGFQIIEGNLMKRILVINLMGRIFSPVHQLDCPFRAADKILEETKNERIDAVIVDFHAEATSEKWALAHYLDSRVSLVYGTHTHVPTLDARIMEGGTAFISDIGMTGPLNSVIGVEKKLIIRHFLTGLPEKHEVAPGPAWLNAVFVTIDEKTRKAVSIIQIQKELQ